MKRSQFAVWITTLAVCAAAFAADDAGFVVSYAEGVAESVQGEQTPQPLEVGADVSSTARVVLYFGAKLSIVAVEGDARGRVITLKGPVEGLLADLVAAAAAATAPVEAVAALRSAPTDDLGAPAATRAGTGPLRPVYPQGDVAAPCGDFLFVSEVEDLDGGWFELRLFDADPAKGAKPKATVRADGPKVDVAEAFGPLPVGRKAWWQVVVRSSDGEEALAGAPVDFHPDKPPAGTDRPPKEFDSPEGRASWHLLRAKSFVKAKLFLDACIEYQRLAAAGGGGAAVDKELRNLEKKLGLGAEDARLLAEAAGETRDGADEIELVDGTRMSGRVVSSDAEGVIFQSAGTPYWIESAHVREVRRNVGVVLPSAAPFVTVTSAHYTLSTNAGKEFGKEALRDLEGLYALFSKWFGEPLGAHNAKNLKARVYRDEVDFAAFLAKSYPDQAKGYGFYSTGDGTLYLFRSFAEGKETTRETLFHEGAHQLMYMRCNQNTSTARMPHYWLTESLPCYLEGLEWKDGALVLERPHRGRAASVVRLRREGKLVALQEFFALSQDGYGTSDAYDQGLGIFWYLMRRDGGKDTAKFLSVVKDYLLAKPVDESGKKHFKRPLAEAASGYADWFAESIESGK
jgi:hypothetical protein